MSLLIYKEFKTRLVYRSENDEIYVPAAPYLVSPAVRPDAQAQARL